MRTQPLRLYVGKHSCLPAELICRKALPKNVTTVVGSSATLAITKSRKSILYNKVATP